MRFPIKALLAGAALFCSSPAWADEAVCRAFYTAKSTEALGIFVDRQASAAEKREKLNALFQQVLDENWIAQFVAAQYWDSSSKAERAEYIPLYEKHLTKYYIDSLDDSDLNNITAIDLLEFKPKGEPDHYFVRTKMTMEGDDPVWLEFTLTEGPKGKCHVRDFKAEGISLVHMERSQMKAIGDEGGGLKAIIAKLKQMDGRE